MEAEALLSSGTSKDRYQLACGSFVYQGTLNSGTYDLLISGAGVLNAACALASYLVQAKPKIIVNAGISGVFEPSGKKIRDVGVATREHYLHTGVAADDGINQPLPFDLIDNHPHSRSGIYPLDEGLALKTADRLKQNSGLFQNCEIFCAPFVTVSAITSNRKTAQKIHKATGAEMESMEGAALAHVALLHHLPFVQIRCASNFTGDREKSDWDIPGAVETLHSLLAVF